MAGKHISMEKESQIRHLIQTGHTYSEVVEEMGVSRGTIYRILHGKTPGQPYGPIAERVCERCGANLPCIRCAEEMRRLSGEMGQEPPKMSLRIQMDAEKRDILNAIRRWRRKHPLDVFRPSVLKEFV